jgi:hypothetical protein
VVVPASTVSVTRNVGSVQKFDDWVTEVNGVVALSR